MKGHLSMKGHCRDTFPGRDITGTLFHEGTLQGLFFMKELCRDTFT